MPQREVDPQQQHAANSSLAHALWMQWWVELSRASSATILVGSDAVVDGGAGAVLGLGRLAAKGMPTLA